MSIRFGKIDGMTELIADPHTGHVRFTRAGFHMVADAGLFSDGRYELLEGEIIKIMPNEPHTYVNSELVFVLAQAFGKDYVRVPSSLAARADSEPEPDASVTVKPRRDYVNSGIPSGSEFRLVVEVSDTTLSRDKGQKAKLYAEAGVPEYWVVDISGRKLLVHRDPVNNEYQSIQTYDDTQSVAPQTAPNHSINIGDILPPTE
jgi:Uma2 family endonuclease